MTRRILAIGAGTLVLALTLASLVGCGREQSLTGPSAGLPSESNLARELPAMIAAEEEPLTADARGRVRSIVGPTVISEPGTYRVDRDFVVDATTGDGIVVRSSGVLLLLGEHTITGPGDRAGRGIVLDGVRDVLVLGGRLRSFGLGVALMSSERCAVRGMRIEGTDTFADPPNGVAPQIGVMLVNSAHNRIARNRIAGANLGLFVRGGGSVSNRLRWNDVEGGVHGLLGICYNPAPGGDAAGPTGDLVVGNGLRRFGKGIQTSSGSSKSRFVANTIAYFSLPWEDFNGTNVFEANRTRQITP